jgi:hypothetical protein
MAVRSESKWWLVAIVSPLVVIGIGILLGLTARSNENDWLGIRFILPIFWAIVVSCFFSLFAAVISLVKKEKFWGVAVLPAIASLCFLVKLANTEIHVNKQAEEQAARQAVQRKHDEEKFKLIAAWEEKFRANPELITNDQLWHNQKDSDQVAKFGLIWLLQDMSFNVTDNIKEFVITNFPDEFGILSHRMLLTKADLEQIVVNPHTGPWPKQFAKQAIERGNFVETNMTNPTATVP